MPQHPFMVGELVGGKGIYIGLWQPMDTSGQSLCKTFAVYAAPEDLTDASGKKLSADFRRTLKELAEKKNWHGHDGAVFTIDSEVNTGDANLYQGLVDGSAIGKWLIPPIELLSGTDAKGNLVQNDSLLRNKDMLGKIVQSRNDENCTGISSRSSNSYESLYCSCTVIRYLVYSTRLSTGAPLLVHSSYGEMSCRPVLVERLAGNCATACCAT